MSAEKEQTSSEEPWITCRPLTREDVENPIWNSDDRRFFERVYTLQHFDPDIIRRIMNFRCKLSQDEPILDIDDDEYEYEYEKGEYDGLPITQAEAEEMLCVLGMNNFPFTGLDISGLRLPFLNLERGAIGGDLVMKNCIINGDVNQKDMVINGNLDQTRMTVKGSVNQNDMTIRGNFIQDEAIIEGSMSQNRMHVRSCLAQFSTTIGGYFDQSDMNVEGPVEQRNISVGEE